MMEKVNRAAKRMLTDGATEARITAVVPTINVIHPIEQAYVNFTQDEYFYAKNTGDGDLSVDVACIKRYIVSAMAVTGTMQPAINAFTERAPPKAQRPWDLLEEHTEGWEEYARRKCSDFHWAMN